MRELILNLNKLFGTQHTKDINRWVSVQYNRISLCNDEPITLKDVSTKEIVLTVSSAITKLSLTPHELFRHCLLVPSINKGLQKFSVVFEIKPSFYKQLLTSCKKISINDMSIVKKGDLFERYGQTKHIKHEVSVGSNEPVYYFINGTIIDSGQPFSLGFNQSELEAVGEEAFEKKYNNANPFNIEEWQDIVFSALFLRLLDDDPAILIINALKQEKIERYRAAKKLCMDYYQKSDEADDTVYASYGRVIAKKFNRFNALTARQNTEIKKPALKIVSSNDNIPEKTTAKNTPVEVKKALNPGDKGYVCDEFGSF
jgi:hypothetical protein